MDQAEAKDRIDAEIERLAPSLLEVSHSIHATPELCFEEHHAHEALCSTAEASGAPVDVTRAAYGLDTAFEMTAGTAGPKVAVVCEYDALPGIGHACGHNVIGAAGLGAGLAAAALAEDLGGRIAILGTPAEEGGGGKLPMIEAGALDEVIAAMMVHPAGEDLPGMDTLAIDQLEVVYSGAAAHAAAAPWEGRNALDAAVLGYSAVAALRQHIGDAERVHGVMLEAGEKANIVPHTARAHWMVRSPTLNGLEALKPRVLACLEGGAHAAGCDISHAWVGPVYADVVTNAALSDAFSANATRLGRPPRRGDDAGQRVAGSTDLGNMSHVVPSIHPMIKISPANVVIHTPAFEACAGAPSGDAAVLDGARAMAHTIIDLWTDAELRDRVAADFEADAPRRGWSPQVRGAAGPPA